MLAASRARWFSKAEHYLDEAIHYARANKLMLIHTGDLIDFVSEANLDAAAMHYRDNDWFVSAGNHEYSLFVGEAKEDEAYKAQSYNKIQDAYPNDLTFCSRVVNGVNFVSIDDVYYNVTERQHELVANEMKRGLPVVLLCHVPFYTPKHCQYELKRNNGSCGYLTGAPLEITSKYATDTSLPEEEQWRNRSVQQRADKATLDFIAWLKEQPLLKGILCGHMHHFYEERFSKTAIQYTVGATYDGDAYEVLFR
jgi:UDP-2,3-diacylglucosamine pyrophosphatase LpxH